MSRVYPSLSAAVCGALLSLAAPMAAQEPAYQEDRAPRIVLTTPAALPAPAHPPALVPLYVGLSVLQAYDGYSTIRGVRGGYVETNPLVGGLASRPALFWSVKAASTAVSIYLAEQYLRDHHPKKAVAVMIVANGLMAAVAARNAWLLKSR